MIFAISGGSVLAIKDVDRMNPTEANGRPLRKGHFMS